jgi:beta-N-acetylhexosaminidase
LPRIAVREIAPGWSFGQHWTLIEFAMKYLGRLHAVGLFFLLAASSVLATFEVRAQEGPDWQQQAESLLQQMTIPERIGQLFMVTFQGDRAAADSQIADLILNYHVGGVALRSQNDNFTGYSVPDGTPQQVKELTGNLQSLALRGFSDEPADVTDEDAVPPSPVPVPPSLPIPLLIATEHDGDSLPVTNYLPGYSPLPNNMAIGATWNPDNARRIGEIAGRELASTGINLLLGPSLDVLERPSPRALGDLGTNSFGGDPYWTGQMGRAYVAGIHAGGEGRLAVSPKSFPGKGSSDRPVTEEVPTVRRSLEQLKQIELAPFFAVTRDSLGSATTADALFATHIRFQGFQGNIRATTAPVSLDPQALNTLMALPEFAGWRRDGGIVISDSLGSQSVERFYDDTRREFPHRQVAKDALLAGNDLLYLSDFALGENDFPTEIANIKDTILWFQGRYETDPAFRQRVDEAVLRVLKLKLRLYEGDFAYDRVTGVAGDANAAPFERAGDNAFFDIAESAVTLLSPGQDELTNRLISPPGLSQQIVIFTDVRQVQPCRSCPPSDLLGETALEDRILALYGPEGSGQVLPDNLTSFSFAELNEFLAAGGAPIFPPTPEPPEEGETPEGPAGITITPEETATAAAPTETTTPAPTPTLPADFRVQEALRDADMLVFALLNAGPNAQSAAAAALSRFLAERPDLVSKSQVVVLAFDAPYFLDSTEISKLTAYYGIYSRAGAFVDAAVRALFLESPLTGASPVSIEGIQYDLFTRTQPDPRQLIELYFVVGGEIESPSRQETLAAAIGDTLYLRTGVIVDHNGNPVPDGTVVRYILRDRVQGTVTILGDRPTADGVAQLDYVLEARMGPGQFRITVESGEAVISQEVDIVIEEGAQLAIIIPTPAPTETPTPMPTPTVTPEPTATAEPLPPTATPVVPEGNGEPGLLIGLADLQSLMGIVAGLIGIGFLSVALNRRGRDLSTSQRLRRFLWGMTAGLLVYNYYALGMPGAEFLAGLGSLAGLLLITSGGLAGLLLYEPVNEKLIR